MSLYACKRIRRCKENMEEEWDVTCTALSSICCDDFTAAKLYTVPSDGSCDAVVSTNGITMCSAVDELRLHLVPLIGYEYDARLDISTDQCKRWARVPLGVCVRHDPPFSRINTMRTAMFVPPNAISVVPQSTFDADGVATSKLCVDSIYTWGGNCSGRYLGQTSDASGLAAFNTCVSPVIVSIHNPERRNVQGYLPVSGPHFIEC